MERFQGESNTINSQLQSAVPLILLGFFGALIVIYKRKWLLLYPLAWSVTAYILFSFHSPVFYHHQLTITIPLALLACAGTAEGILSLVHVRQPSDLLRLQTLMGVFALAGFLLVVNYYRPVLDKELMNRPRISGFDLKATAGKLKVLDVMNEYAGRTNWIVTDVPIYAFRVHKPVPPSLATFSQKRMSTGSLTEDDVLKAMREYRPEMVLMARFNIPALETYLQENYTLVVSPEFYRLFVRNDLDPTPE
jgi:hypothetical protein